jgi:hypothetical protein
VGVEGLVSPGIIPELKDTDVTVGRCASQEASALMRSPRYHVYGSGVKREIEDFGPGAAAGGGGRVLRLLAPDQDLAIVRGGGQNRAEFGVCLVMK